MNHLAPRLWLAAAVAFVPLTLLADGAGLARQSLLGALTALFLAALVRSCSVDLRHIAAAILIATTGECILSIGWGLYSYRHGPLPAYVPFGHGVFYALAVALARDPLLVRRSRAVVALVLTVGSIWAVISLVTLNDVWGLLWWLAAALLIVRSRNALLLSVCAVLTMALELIGTSLGNWRWSAVVPGTSLHSANPPSGVGLLYVLLDLTVVAVSSAPLLRPGRRVAAPAVASD